MIEAMKYTKWITVLFCLLGLAACRQDAPRFRIGVAQCSDDSWRHKMNDEILREAMFYDGVSVEIRSAADDNRKQAEDVHYFIDKGVDLLIISANEAAPMTPIVEEAYQKGIPVILVDRKILSDKYTAYIGADNYEIGRAVGNYIASSLKGKGNVVELTGLGGSTPAMERHQGFMAAISNYPDIKLIDKADAAWEREPAEVEMDSMLRRHPKIDAVYAHNDRIAPGAYQAAKKAGREKEMIFVGIDALPGKGNGLELVLDNVLDATFIYPTNGDKVMQLAMNILEKKSYPRETVMNTAVVDRTNAHVMQLQTTHISELDQKIETLNGRIGGYLSRVATQQVVMYGGLVILLLVAGLLLVVYKSLRSKNRLNKELSEQKKQVEQQRDKLEEQRDILEEQRDKLEEQRDQLIQLSHQLEEATHAKLVFFTNISHDFRTPLTLVADPVEHLLADSSLSEDQRRMLLLVQRNVNILLRLVNQILDFRKIQNKKMKMQVQRVDIVPFVRKVMDNFEAVAEEHRIDFLFQTEKEHLYLWVDADKLEKIVFNLLSNAFKYTPNGKMITMFIREDEKTVSIGVQDQGIGIAENKKKSLFVRFENLVDKNLFNQASTGIGLSLVKELVEMHKATISVDSHLGEGSCFKVDFLKGKEHYDKEAEFILEDADAPARMGQVVDIANSSIQSETLVSDDSEKIDDVYGEEFAKEENSKELMLLVEDNQELREFLRSIFSPMYRVVEAADGKEGASKALKYLPDIIISDVMMPEKDGIEMTRELRADMTTSHIPIILLTAKTTIESKLEGLEYGADDYITKPFSATYLQARVENLLMQRKKLQSFYRDSLMHINISTGQEEVPVATDMPSAEEDVSETPPTTLEMSPNDRKFMDKLVELMEQNMDNGELVVDDLVRELAVSRSVFFKKLKTLTGLAPIEFIKEMRIKRATQLIETGEFNMTQISYMVGINDPRYFSKCFKAQVGMTPTEYRDRVGR